MTTAKFSDILEGYEFCDFGDGMGAQAFISLERGTVHLVAEDMDLDEAPPVDLDTGSYLALPDKAELRLGKSLALQFTEAHLPDELPTVLGYFRQRGAYSRFKRLLQDKGALEAWFAFEAAETEARLRAWSADNGIHPA
jgi:hypothetical protein